MALIAQYLLHLAASSRASELHNRSAQSALDQMKAFGLTRKQRAVIATGDQIKISAALADELPAADPSRTVTFDVSGVVKTCAIEGLELPE